MKSEAQMGVYNISSSWQAPVCYTWLFVQPKVVSPLRITIVFSCCTLWLHRRQAIVSKAVVDSAFCRHKFCSLLNSCQINQL